MDVSDMSISSSPIPKGTITIENVESQDMNLNLQNLKQPPIPKKNYMSPTVSAASKANPPRKKVLAERNDSLDTPLQKNPNPDSKTISSTEFSENEQNALADDLSSRHYDPLTNYPSPRPKFLRYKPNRRSELFLQRENEVKDVKSEIKISTGVSFGSMKGIVGEGGLGGSCRSMAAGTQESNEEQEDKEIEESEEEFDELEEDRGWSSRGVLKFLLLLVALVLSTSYISTMNSPTPSPVVQAVVALQNQFNMIQDHVYEFAKNLEFGNHLLIEREGKEMGLNGIDRIEEEEMIEGEKIYNELNQVADIQKGESKFVEMVKGEEDEAMNALGEVGDGEDLKIAEGEEKRKVEDFGEVAYIKAEEIASDPDMVLMNSKLEETQAIEVSGLPVDVDGVDHLGTENESVKEPVGNEIVSIGKSSTTEAIKGLKWGLINNMETESILKFLIGVSVFSSFVASLVLVFHFNRKKNVRQVTSPITPKPCCRSVQAEKHNSILASKEDEHSKSLINLMEDHSRDIFETRVPSIQLLSEFDISEMSSHSVSRTIENEVSSKAHSVPIHVQPAFLEVSSIDSPSHGRFLNTNKKENQEGGDGEVSKVVTTTTITPLRRSSRLRSRAIVA